MYSDKTSCEIDLKKVKSLVGKKFYHNLNNSSIVIKSIECAHYPNLNSLDNHIIEITSIEEGIGKTVKHSLELLERTYHE